MSYESTEMVEVPVDRVLRFTPGNKAVVCIVGDDEVMFPVNEIQFAEEPVVIDEPCMRMVPRWIVLDRGLDYLIE